MIGLGLDSFDFHSGDNLNEKYSFKENLTLITIYVLIYSFIGNIALIPHDIIQKGYILFDLQYISDKKEPKKNGYIFAYLFSMVISAFIKIILDRKFVFDEVKLRIENKTGNSFFSYTIIIILIYFCSMFSSLVFYWIYTSIFTKIKKNKNNTSHKAIKILGYLIYWETTNGCCVHCIDCQKAIKKCSHCLGFHECECCCCCYYCCEDYDEAEYGQKQLCIIYKLKGLCSWAFDILAGIDMFKIVIIIYSFELINLGFKPELANYLDTKCNENQILILNIISFVSLLFFYFLNLVIGIFHVRYSNLGIESIKLMEDSFGYIIQKSEYNYIFQPITIFALITIIFNVIISALFYYKTSKDLIYYFIPFSISISEYVNIILIYLAQGDQINVNIIKKSFAISIYKIIFSIIKYFIDISNPDNLSLIFFQFIIGCIFFFILFFTILCGYFATLCCVVDHHRRKFSLSFLNQEERKGEEEENYENYKTSDNLFNESVKGEIEEKEEEKKFD